MSAEQASGKTGRVRPRLRVLVPLATASAFSDRL
jgi:hypothetical protein